LDRDILTSEELARCRKDFPFFAERVLRVASKSGEIKPLKFNRAQRYIWSVIEPQMKQGLPVRVAILKCRQAGISTFVQGLMYWWVTTHRNTHGLCLANSDATSQNIFSIARGYYELAPFPKPKHRYSSKRELRFENPDVRKAAVSPGLRSSIRVKTAGSPDAARSYTFQFLHLSEVAYYPRPDEVLGSLMPSIPSVPGTFVIFESTAKGGNDWWYEFWTASSRGETGYEAVFIPWHWIEEYTVKDAAVIRKWIPSYDPEDPESWKAELDDYEVELVQKSGLTVGQIAWRRMKIAEMMGSEEMFCREFPATPEEAFIFSSNNVFDLKALQDSLEHLPAAFVGEIHIAEDASMNRIPVLEENENGRFTIWEPPEPGVDYAVGVDPGTGTQGGSLSACCVVRFDEKANQWIQVAEWAGIEDPVSLGRIAEAICRYYNMAMLCIEFHGPGVGTLPAALEHYPMMFRWRKWDEPGLPVTKKLGWLTTPTSKPILVAFAQYVVKYRGFRFRSTHLFNELANYISDDEGATFGPARGFDDDRAHAAMMALYTHYAEYSPPYKMGEDLETLLNRLGKSRKPSLNEAREVMKDVEGKRDPEFYRELAEARASSGERRSPYEGFEWGDWDPDEGDPNLVRYDWRSW
jgi:hypothetical protein